MGPERYQHWLISLFRAISPLFEGRTLKTEQYNSKLSLGNVEPDLRCGQALDLLVRPSLMPHNTYT